MTPLPTSSDRIALASPLRPFLPSTVEWRRYWNIIVYRTYAELKAEAQLNHMGYIWWLLEPLLNTVLFYLILVAVMEQGKAGSVSFILVAAITWQWFSASVLNSSGSIFDAGGILKQVYLPKIILPLITLFANLWKFGFIFALLLLWLWCTGSLPNVSYLALPSLLLLEFGVILAISLPLAALIPYFPDARVTVDALLRSLMLISGIFFPPEKLPPAYHFLFFLNPMAVLIDNYRRILLYDLWPSWNQLAGVGLFCLASFLFTFLFYRTIDQSVVKAIHR